MVAGGTESINNLLSFVGPQATCAHEDTRQLVISSAVEQQRRHHRVNATREAADDRSRRGVLQNSTLQQDLIVSYRAASMQATP